MAFYQKNDKFNLYFNLQVVSLWIAAFSGNVALKAGENHIALRLAEPAARDMFRFASMRLIRR